MDIFLLIIIVIVLIGAPVAFLLDKKELEVLSLKELKKGVKRNKQALIFLFIVFIIMIGIGLWRLRSIQENYTLFVILCMPLGTTYFHLISIIFLKRTIKQKEQEVQTKQNNS